MARGRSTRSALTSTAQAGVAPRPASIVGAVGEAWAREAVVEAWELAAEENRLRLRADLRARLRVPPDTPASEIARRAPLAISNGGLIASDREMLPVIAEAAGEQDLARQLAEGFAQFNRLPLEVRPEDEQYRATFERRRARRVREFERLREPSERQRLVVEHGIGDEEEIASAMLAPLLEQMLVDGNRDAAAALIAEHLGRIDPDLAARAAAPGRIEHLERLVRALSEMGEGLGYSSDELWEHACDASERHVKFLASPRGRGDDALHVSAALSPFKWSRSYLKSLIYAGPQAQPVDDLIRETVSERSLLASGFTESVPSDGEAITIRTNPAALVPLMEEMDGRGLSPRLLAITSRRNVQTAGRQSIFLGVRVEGILEDRPTAITFTGGLALETRAMTEKGVLDAVRKAAPGAWAWQETRGQVWEVTEWEGALREGFTPDESVSLGQLPAQWAASNPCRHPHAVWKRNLSGDAAVLHCMDCGAQAIAAVPLHRIPQGHPKAGISDEPYYLSRERMYAVLRGDDPGDVPESVAELTARDGLVKMAPELWLGEQTPLERRSRPLGEGIDVSALAKRRR